MLGSTKQLWGEYGYRKQSIMLKQKVNGKPTGVLEESRKDCSTLRGRIVKPRVIRKNVL